MFMTGWKFTALVGGMVGALGLVLYPIAIGPMIDSKEYKDVQKTTRAGINQEDIQPGNMKVWSDPFVKNDEK